MSKKPNRLVEVLVERDGLTEQEVIDWITDAFHSEYEGDLDCYDVESFLMDEFGIEPDYVFDLLELVS